MNRRHFLSIVALGFLAAGGTASMAEPDAPAPMLLEVVNGEGKGVPFTAADLAKLSQKEIAVKDHKGDEAKYAGVLVSDVLKSADKYRVIFSLPEVDPDWTDNVVLLATSRNGAALDAARGPLQIVLPAEKRHSRWVKQVVRLTVRTDSK